MGKADSLEKTLMLGKTEGKGRRGQQRMRWLNSITDSMDMNLSKLWDSGGQRPACCNQWGSKVSVGHDLVTEQQQQSFLWLSCWRWSSNTWATWSKELTHWKKPWCWERLKAGEEGDNRGWDRWMASVTQWTWVWARSRKQWRMGKPGVLQSMGVTKSWTCLSNWTTNEQLLT